MKTSRLYSTSLLIGLVSSLALAACEDGSNSGIKGTSFPDLVVEPEQIVLPAVAEGASTNKAVTIRNDGGNTLIITDISFDNAIDRREFTKQHPEPRLEMQPGEEITVLVVYSPQDLGNDSGNLIIVSNDPDQRETRVPISTASAEASLLVTPDRLLFNAEDPAPQTESVKVQNLGTVKVNVTGVRLSEDTAADFTLAEGHDARPTLAQDELVQYGVTYTPTGGDTDFGTLIIETDSTDRPVIEIPLEGIEPRPDILVSPESVVFGAVDLNGESERIVVAIENRGNAPLTVESIDFGVAPEDVNAQFTLHDLPAEFPMVINDEDLFTFGVTYHPAIDGEHMTSIAIRSDDPQQQVVTVPVSGRVRKPCISVAPALVEFGRVALGEESARSDLQVQNCGDLPLDVNELVIEGDGFHFAPEGEEEAPQSLAIEPLETVTLDVWFHNENLGENERRDGMLTLRNNTPDNPEVQVPLIAIGGGAPTCDMLIIPNRQDFGLVARGNNRTRTLEAVNRGTGRCEVRGEEIAPLIEIPIPGFNQVMFALTRPLGARNVAPGEFAQFDITYRPQVFGAHSAIYTLSYFDPFSPPGMQEKTATAQLAGVAGENNIEVIPGRLDFGRVTAGECASQTERVTVYNTGIVDLCIRDVYLDDDMPGCAEFVIVDRPVANEDGCIIVTRNSPAEVRAVYEPDNLGEDECHLIFESDDQDNPQMRVPLEGEGIRDREQTDVFEQTSGQTVDILFVVDNSGSMQEEQENLRDNFRQFISGADQFANDYQLGIVTTDMQDPDQSGRLLGDPRIMTRGPNVEAQFQDTIEVGTNGAGEEHGLEAAHAALSDPLIFDTGVMCAGDGDCLEPDRCVNGFCGGHNRGFLRDNAALELVFVSDEDDYSPGTLNFYVDFFKNIKGFRNDGLFHAHAIVGARNGRAAQCQSADGNADAGRRYAEVSDRTNGGVYSICDADYSDNLRELGNQAFGLPVQFFLSRPAVRASIEVTVDGQRRGDGWEYDEASNSVIFDQATVPDPGQIITVTYEAQCFPRQD